MVDKTYCLKHYRQTFPDKGCDLCELEAEVAALKGTARAMFAAEEEYGCGFYNYPKWVAAYSTLAALVEK